VENVEQRWGILRIECYGPDKTRGRRSSYKSGHQRELDFAYKLNLYGLRINLLGCDYVLLKRAGRCFRALGRKFVASARFVTAALRRRLCVQVPARDASPRQQCSYKDRHQ